MGKKVKSDEKMLLRKGKYLGKGCWIGNCGQQGINYSYCWITYFYELLWFDLDYARAFVFLSMERQSYVGIRKRTGVGMKKKEQLFLNEMDCWSWISCLGDGLSKEEKNELTWKIWSWFSQNLAVETEKWRLVGLLLLFCLEDQMTMWAGGSPFLRE